MIKCGHQVRAELAIYPEETILLNAAVTPTRHRRPQPVLSRLSRDRRPTGASIRASESCTLRRKFAASSGVKFPMFEPRRALDACVSISGSCQTFAKTCLTARNLDAEGFMHAGARVFEGGCGNINQVDALWRNVAESAPAFRRCQDQLDDIETRPGGTDDLVAMCLQQFRFARVIRVPRQPHDRIEQCRPSSS